MGHGLVVDYIGKLLADVSPHVDVCDTHILKLRHLVHIKQSYHATAKSIEGEQCDEGGKDAEQPTHRQSSFGLSAFFCRKMSPTPAVCGLPLDVSRQFISAAEN